MRLNLSEAFSLVRLSFRDFLKDVYKFFIILSKIIVDDPPQKLKTSELKHGYLLLFFSKTCFVASSRLFEVVG